MANNIDVKDGAGATKTLKTTDNGTDHSPHHNVDKINGVAPAFGSGVLGATVQRFTQATDDAGVVSLGQIAASASVLDDWDESDRAKVNLVVGQAGVTAGAGAVAANTPRVTLASDDPLLTALGAVTASPTANTLMDRVKALLTGTILAAGSAIIGKVGIDQTSTGTTNGVAIIAGYSASGKTPWFLNATTGTNAQTITGTSVKFYGGVFTNTHATQFYFVKLFNKASTPTVGTDIPTLVFGIPPRQTIVIDENIGITFGTGLGICIVQAGATSDTTGVGTLGDICLTLYSKT